MNLKNYDIQRCNNYKGIKLLSYTMKLWARVIQKKLRRYIAMSDKQFDFMVGRSTIEVIHLIRRLMEFWRNRKKEFPMVFIYLEKAYDILAREVFWSCLEKKHFLSDSILSSGGWRYV